MNRTATPASSRPSDREKRVERPRRRFDRDFSTPLARARSARNDATIFTSRSEAGTERIATRFAKTLRGGEVILLDGDLGAGKTAFVRGLAKGLGVRDRITSPTFVLMRIHRADSRKPIANSQRSQRRSQSAIGYRLLAGSGYGLSAIGYLVHVDAYRVHDASALEAIGLHEWAGKPDTIVAIEWGERVRDIFLHSTFHIHSIHLSSPTATQRIIKRSLQKSLS